jgi:hypothetical protein
LFASNRSSAIPSFHLRTSTYYHTPLPLNLACKQQASNMTAIERGSAHQNCTTLNVQTSSLRFNTCNPVCKAPCTTRPRIIPSLWCCRKWCFTGTSQSVACCESCTLIGYSHTFAGYVADRPAMLGSNTREWGSISATGPAAPLVRTTQCVGAGGTAESRPHAAGSGGGVRHTMRNVPRHEDVNGLVPRHGGGTPRSTSSPLIVHTVALAQLLAHY